MTERNVLIVLRVADSRPDRLALGSTQGACSRCNAPIWLSPSAAAVQGQIPVVCLHCVTPEEKAAVQRQGVRLLPGARREIAEHFARRN